MSKFEAAVQIVTACTKGSVPQVSVQVVGGAWTIRISDQVVVYKGATLDEACDSLILNWRSMAADRRRELEQMAGWIDEVYREGRAD